MIHARIAVALMVVVGGEAAASSGPAPPWFLSLTDCIDRALLENLSLNVKRLEPELAALDVTAADARFDVRFDTSGAVSETQSASAASELDGSDQPTTERQSFGGNLAKRLLFGTDLRVGTSVNELATDSSFSTLNPAIGVDVDLEIRQPLLKEAGKTVNRAALTRAEIAVDQSDQRLRASVLDLVRDVEIAYWSLALAHDRLNVAESAMASSRSLLKETQAKLDQGLMTEVDVLQAAADEASKEEALLVARQEIADSEDRLLALLNGFAEAGGRGLAVEPLPDRLPGIPNVDVALERATRMRPEYQLLELARREDDLDVAVARADRRPTLDVRGRGGFSGRDDTYRDAYDGMLNGDGHVWEVDLFFEMPWGIRAERAALRQAELRRLQGNLDLADADVALLRDIRSGCRAVETGVARVKSTRKSLVLQERQFAQERARYDAGLVTIRDTLLAQDNVNEARLRVLVALRDTIEAVVRLARLEGSLLDVHGIEWRIATEGGE